MAKLTFFDGESVGVAVVGSREGLAEGFTVGYNRREKERRRLPETIMSMKLHDWR